MTVIDRRDFRPGFTINGSTIRGVGEPPRIPTVPCETPRMRPVTHWAWRSSESDAPAGLAPHGANRVRQSTRIISASTLIDGKGLFFPLVATRSAYQLTFWPRTPGPRRVTVIVRAARLPCSSCGGGASASGASEHKDIGFNGDRWREGLFSVNGYTICVLVDLLAPTSGPAQSDGRRHMRHQCGGASASDASEHKDIGLNGDRWEGPCFSH